MQIFLDRIPDLRVCFDTNHCLIEDNCDYIRAVGPKIVTLHVSDYDFTDEKHWIPGEGKNDWEGIIRTLEEADYSGRFLYETGGAAKCREIYANYKSLMGL
jgi:sugar phosphate isomerase/epimerase